ncbi:VOC family protein [Chloroflexota bacterium]
MDVGHAQKVAENYWNILGISPWEIYEWEAPLVYDHKYHGKLTWGREKMTLAQVGSVQLELMEPVDGDSVHRDFLMEHSKGLHHLNFLVDDVDETAEILADKGFVSLQSGRWETREEKGPEITLVLNPSVLSGNQPIAGK